MTKSLLAIKQVGFLGLLKLFSKWLNFGYVQLHTLFDYKYKTKKRHFYMSLQKKDFPKSNENLLSLFFLLVVQEIFYICVMYHQ